MGISLAKYRDKNQDRKACIKTLLSSPKTDINALKSLDLSLLLDLGQLDVGGGPEVAKVADREVDAQTHLGSHNDKGDVPSQCRDDEQKCATSLQTT